MGLLTQIQTLEELLDKLEGASIINAQNTAVLTGDYQECRPVEKSDDLSVAGRIFSIGLRLHYVAYSLDKNVQIISDTLNGRPEIQPAEEPAKEPTSPPEGMEPSNAPYPKDDPDFDELESSLLQDFDTALHRT